MRVYVCLLCCNSCFVYDRFSPKDDVKSYNIYGVTVLEVEVDILTGQHLVNIFLTVNNVILYIQTENHFTIKNQFLPTGKNRKMITLVVIF